MTDTRAFSFNRTATRLAAALVVVLAAGTFFYANRSADTYASPAKAVSTESALHRPPAITGIDTMSDLLW